MHSFFILFSMKKFKTRKKYNLKLMIILIIIFFILFIWVSIYSLKCSNNRIIDFLLKDFGNAKYNINYLSSNLDLLFNNYSFKEEKIVYNERINKIYIYNTHDKEQYHDNTGIIEVSNMLSNNLNKLGIKSVVEKEKCSDYINSKVSYYDVSREFLKKNLNKSFDYLIDIHRDSVKNTTITINNKKYAKIMFVLGLDNPNYLETKKLIKKMNDYLNEEYPGISRGIYEKKGYGVNGKYNQDLSNNIILIEVGGIENNYLEVNNSTEILSLMFYHILGE